MSRTFTVPPQPLGNLAPAGSEVIGRIEHPPVALMDVTEQRLVRRQQTRVHVVGDAVNAVRQIVEDAWVEYLNASIEETRQRRRRAGARRMGVTQNPPE